MPGRTQTDDRHDAYRAFARQLEETADGISDAVQKHEEAADLYVDAGPETVTGSEIPYHKKHVAIHTRLNRMRKALLKLAEEVDDIADDIDPDDYV